MELIRIVEDTIFKADGKEDRLLIVPKPLEYISPIVNPPKAKLIQIDAKKQLYKIQIIDEIDDQNLADYATSSIISSRRELDIAGSEPVVSLKTMQHDMTFSHLSNNTDKKIIDIFHKVTEEMKGNFLQQSPDDFVILKDCTVLVEYATRQTNEIKSLAEAYNDKIRKYSLTASQLLTELKRLNLEEKFKEHYGRIILLIICVNYNSVYSNACLTQTQVDELCYRYSFFKNTQKTYEYGEDHIEETPAAFQLNDYLSTFNNDFIDPRFLKENRGSKTLLEYSIELMEESLSQRTDKMKQSLVTSSTLAVEVEVDRHREKIREVNPDGFNEHQKSVCNMPLVFCTHNIDRKLNFFSEVEELEMPNVDDPVMSVFRSAINYGRDNLKFIAFPYDQDFKTNTEEEIISEIESLNFLNPTPSEQRANYNRFVYSINAREEELLAAVGFGGKKFKSNEFVKNYREEKKKGYDLLWKNCSDIEEFLENKQIDELFLEVNDETDVSTNYIIKLINRSLKEHSSIMNDSVMESVRLFSKTNYFKWMQLISDIATECCISFRQHCKPSTVIIKKLLRFNCYLLIKPTRLYSHLFFSIIFPPGASFPVEEGSVFRRMHESQGWRWTDVISLNESKAENWSISESRAIQLFFYYLDFFRLPINEWYNHKPLILKSGLFKLLKLTTMIHLNDKKEVEENSALLRYMSMEGFKKFPISPEPQKLISKFTTKIRSRLTVWIQLKLIDFATYIIDNPFQISSEELTQEEKSSQSGHILTNVKWTGLVNPFFLDQQLRGPSQLLNLMYLGYAVNKNQKNETNALGRLLEKIVKMEKNFISNKDKFYQEDKEIGDDGLHTYNCEFLTLVIDFVIENHLKRNFGSTILEEIDSRITTEISETYLEDVALTLKATSNFSEEWYDYNPEKIYSRSKVIEKCLKYTPEGSKKVRIIDILPDCLDHLVKLGGIDTDIFDKMQHSGIREIFVLTFEGRIVQWVIERIARIICSYFEGETMTHPKNKQNLPILHQRECKKKFKSQPIATYCVSADASKWSQTQHSLKFSRMFKRILNPKWHKFIDTVLSLWLNKKIMIPNSLMKILASDSATLKEFYDPVMKEIYEGFKGISATPLINFGESFIKIESGMMQGILHYTSSLCHSFLNKYLDLMLPVLFSTRTKGSSLKVTTMQSSDDSCLIMTFSQSPDQLENRKKFMTVLAFCDFKRIAGDLMGFSTSVEKTTEFTPFLFEFNSNFYFGSAHYEPDIKASYASLVIPERESLIDKQDQMYNSITNYIGMGGSFLSASFHQIAQAFLFYRLLGCSVTKRFDLLSELMFLYPDPSLGFFVLDNPINCGLGGFTYNVWNLVRSTKIGFMYQNCLDMLKKGNINMFNKNVTLEITNVGLLLRTKSVLFGKREKIKRIKKRLNIDDNWKETYNDEPMRLFMKCETESHLKTLMAKKLSQPGVAESLSTGNSTARQIAFSAYALQSRVLLDKQLEGEDKWTNILTSLKDIYLSMTSLEASVVINVDDLKFLFPLHDEYVKFKTISEKINGVLIHSTREYKRVQTKVEIYEGDDITVVPLVDCMQYMWYQRTNNLRNLKLSGTTYKSAFEFYRTKIPWLKPDIMETLANSPFDYVTDMINWMSQYKTKSRVVKISGASISHRKGLSSLPSVLMQNVAAAYRISSKFDPVKHIETDSSEVNNQLVLTLASFSSYGKKTREVLSILSKNSSIEFDKNKVRSRDNTLAIFSKFSSNVCDSEIFKLIELNKNGIIGGYIIRQKYSRSRGYHGVGIWLGSIYGTKCRLSINTIEEKSVVTDIYIESVAEMDEFFFGLRIWLSENDCVTLDEIGSSQHFRSSHDKNLICFFNGMVACQNKFATPVHKISKIEVEYNKEVIEFEIFQHTLRLFITIKSFDDRDVKVTLINYPLKKMDLKTTPMCKPEEERSIASYWKYNQALPEDIANKLVEDFIKYKKGLETDYKGKNSREFYELIESLIKKRLQTYSIGSYQSVIKEIFTMPYKSSFDEDIKIDMDIDDMDFDVDEFSEFIELEDGDMYDNVELEMNFLYSGEIDTFDFEDNYPVIDYVRQNHNLFNNYLRSPIDNDRSLILALRMLFKERIYNEMTYKYLSLAECLIGGDFKGTCLPTTSRDLVFDFE